MQLNNQPIEKTVHSDLLDVHSVFYTIQGEGPHTGRPAVFVRLAGCNLQCPMCDTDYTSTRWKASPQSLLEIVQEQKMSYANKVDYEPRPLVVITGGEPFRQNIAPAVEHLIGNGYDIQIETNGTLPIPDSMIGCYDEENLMIVVSPKAGKVHPSIADNADAWKYVMRVENIAPDGLPSKALDHSNGKGLARHPSWVPITRIYIQPCDEQEASKNKANLDACVASALHNGYTLQTQLHKTIGVD
jgi:7-carboxy-7-deazaguanine synthase